MEKNNEKLINVLDDIDKTLTDQNVEVEASSEENKSQDFATHILLKQGVLQTRQFKALTDLLLEVKQSYQDTKHAIKDLSEFLIEFPNKLPKKMTVDVESTPLTKEVTVSNLKDIPKVVIPENVTLNEPTWIGKFYETLTDLITLPLIKVLNKKLDRIEISAPTDPKKAIAVRLSDGKEFYKAFFNYFAPSGAGGGSISATVTVTALPISSSFDHGAKSGIGTSVLQMTTSNLPATQGVLVKAANTNGAGKVYVGNSDVTAVSSDLTDGFELGAGESITLKIDNANKVYLIGSTTGLRVVYIVI